MQVLPRWLQIWGGHAVSILTGDVMFDWCAGRAHRNGFTVPLEAASKQANFTSAIRELPAVLVTARPCLRDSHLLQCVEAGVLDEWTRWR
jgi:hypothetical protein